MPDYTFGDEDNLEFKLLADGDYTFEVLSVEFGIHSGGKHAGTETMNIRFGFYSPTGEIVAKWKENFLLNKEFGWKVDTFLKSADFRIEGRSPVKGDNIGAHLTEENLIGLRGWCFIHVEEYTPRNGGEKKKTNRVKTWWTNKEKLPRKDTADIPFAD